MTSSATAVPVLRVRNLPAVLPYYRRVLGFSLAQEVPGVIALLRKRAITLSLWSSQANAPSSCNIALGIDADLFTVFSEMASLARSAIVEDFPLLRPWGFWDFSMCDPEGNRLTFAQSAACCAVACTLKERIAGSEKYSKPPK